MQGRLNVNQFGAPFLFVATALSLATCAPAQAQLYKWKDKSGATHYTQTPPPNTSYKQRIIQETPAPSAADQAAAEERLDNDRADLAKMNRRIDQLKQDEQRAASPTNQAANIEAQSCRTAINQATQLLMRSPTLTGLPELSYCWKTPAANDLASFCTTLASRGLYAPYCGTR